MYMRTDFRIRNIHVIANNELCTIFVVISNISADLCCIMLYKCDILGLTK